VQEYNNKNITKKDIIKAVDKNIQRYGRERDKVIPVLLGVQYELNYLPPEALKYICETTDITPGQISGVATFFTQFRHQPAGKHIIKICTGTACHVKGSPVIFSAFRRVLKIDKNFSASEDGLFSIEEVACLGCCTLAPVVQIDNKTYGHVKATDTENILKDFLRSKKDADKKVIAGYIENPEAEIRVGLGSCCIASGSNDIKLEVENILSSNDINASVKPVGCVGVCNQTPMIEIVGKNHKTERYTKVRKEQVNDIILKHLTPLSYKKKIRNWLNDWIDTFSADEILTSPVTLPKNVREKHVTNFLQYQKHIATENYGTLSPVSFDEYRQFKGFDAIEHCLNNKKPGEVITEIIKSGLRGRGGGGYSAGHKWESTANAKGDNKYVICNGDEGDPGAFMDRMLLESYPFRILEGMIIAAYATGANEGILYIRAEYPLAVERINNAIKICAKKGFIGNNIFGTGFSFKVRVFEGAGAFVCGEETALIASLEGRRGTPHFRPPYPSEKGLGGKPTLVNNVETFCMIPWIIRNGAEAFNSTGTEKNKGTKVFALAGKVAKGGLIEVPMGITIRQIVENIGDGVTEGRKFKAVQIGGPSGGCIPEKLADTPVDFEELNHLGAMMGSGGLVVLDDTDCMVDMAKYFLTFTHQQSCGKCTYCRIGTKYMLQILTRLSKGEAGLEEIEELEKLCHDVKNGSLCGLGKSSPNPVLTSLKYFREEYEAHTRGICPVGKCPDLIRYHINDNCIGCTICARECPVEAIAYKPYEKHEIDNSKCTKCDSCRLICPNNAVEKIAIND